jgi:hypothetical protein
VPGDPRLVSALTPQATETMGKWSTYTAAGVMGFAFAFGGVYLNAREGTKVEAEEPDPNVATIDVNVLRRLMVDPPPVQADAADRKRSGYPREVLERPGPGRREDHRQEP